MKQEYINYMKNQIRELVEDYDTEIIINNRVAKPKQFEKDFGTPEQEHPEDSLNYIWEACYTMNNSWGFKKSDTDWKNPNTVFSNLKDINSKGGNFLLNIGPDGDGNVPQESVDILLEVGKMLKND